MQQHVSRWPSGKRARTAAAACATGAALAISALPALGRGSAMHVMSPSFRNGQTIPARYTCSGRDISPPLRFGGVPARAQALALTLIDRTAHGFTHWTVWNISPRIRGLAAGRVPQGSRQGANDFGRFGYGGPCPPVGQKPHHYVLTLYALDRRLPLSNGAPPEAAEADIRAAALGHATLLGRFGRSGGGQG